MDIIALVTLVIYLWLSQYLQDCFGPEAEDNVK